MRVSIFITLYMTITVLIMLGCGSIPLKLLIKRKRPEPPKCIYRIWKMHGKEDGKQSMPSGDAAVAAFVCWGYLILFDNPWIFVLIVPLTCLSRVYVHCHWFGDTIVGAILGTVFAIIFFQLYFLQLAMPLFQWVIDF